MVLVVEALGVGKAYGKKVVLSGVDFLAQAGACAAVVGRNGAGKSTLLAILAGYLAPDSGSVARGGEVAYCPQTDSLFEDLSVKDNLRFWARVAFGRFGASGECALDFAELFGVADYLKKRVSRLSGGMRKCVAIACAMAGDPPLLILDEPFASLDIYHKNTLLRALGLLKAKGKCIVYTSHNLDEIVGLDSKIYTLVDGNLNHVGAEEFAREMRHSLHESRF